MVGTASISAMIQKSLVSIPKRDLVWLGLQVMQCIDSVERVSIPKRDLVWLGPLVVPGGVLSHDVSIPKRDLVWLGRHKERSHKCPLLRFNP